MCAGRPDVQYSEALNAMAGPRKNEQDTLKAKQQKACRLLIFERDPFVRDKCARLAANLNCDLYSTAYIEDFEKVIGRFEPSCIVIDIGLLASDGLELLRVVAKDAPIVKILFLASDDSELDEAAEDLARSVGLHVQENLQRPVSETQLEQSLRRLAQ